MKLITWNCQGAFRKKADTILKLKPDILVVQECEHPDKLIYSSNILEPTAFYWHGDNNNKGLAIYSFSDYKFTLLQQFNPEYRYVLPFNVEGSDGTFTLFAIWAMDNKKNYKARYIGQVWRAINYYLNVFNDSTILIGDFNSNKTWDSSNIGGSHSDVVAKLASRNIFSAYHRHFEIDQGDELHPTFYLQRNQNKPYHIDYCFASEKIINKLQDVEVGRYEEWSVYSDHSPLIINFNF